MWDLAAGKSMATLTNHKKSVRSIVLHPKLYMFASASPDNIKEWRLPQGQFIQNLSGHNAIINCQVSLTGHKPNFSESSKIQKICCFGY